MPAMACRAVAFLFLVVGISLGTASCSESRAPDTTRGAAIYAQQCARCHAVSGEGITGPSLIGITDVFVDASGQERFVSNGGGDMPKFGEILSEAEISDVVAYTRKTFG